MEYTKELMEKAKNAANADALRALAKENGWDMNQEEAKAYFEELHKTGALSDEELENVTGGGCRHDGHLIVTLAHGCDKWRCKVHGVPLTSHGATDKHKAFSACTWCGRRGTCSECKFCTYTGGLWLCMNPQK